MPSPGRVIHGVLAEFSGAGPLLQAAAKARAAGYAKYDCHSPFPIHGMDRAMGLKRSPLGYMIGASGALALIGMTTFIWWASAVDYPLVISGKELFSFQAFVPPIFAITILASAVMATFGMIALNRLPRLHHPLFEAAQFARVTDGGFFLSIEAQDPAFEREGTVAWLQSVGAISVEVVEQP